MKSIKNASCVRLLIFARQRAPVLASSALGYLTPVESRPAASTPLRSRFRLRLKRLLRSSRAAALPKPYLHNSWYRKSMLARRAMRWREITPLNGKISPPTDPRQPHSYVHRHSNTLPICGLTTDHPMSDPYG